MNGQPIATSAAVMYWDGGERAITPRERALIEEHRPSCFSIPLLPVEAVDPTDPWRGLYRPVRMPAPSEYGDLTHPDVPRWPDDREDALDTLVHAQGFDFHIVAGDFTETALEDGDEVYWQEMRDWNPEAPEGEWRLAWKGDTEDGPYAWFVRPMALRPKAVAPPAQGIDLGPLAEALRKADSLIKKSNKLSADSVMGLILAPHVRALIDGRDAGAGVSQ